MTILRENYRSLAVSLLIHLILLLVLALSVVAPVISPHWYEFDFSSPAAEPEINQTIKTGGDNVPIPFAKGTPQVSTKQPLLTQAKPTESSPQPQIKNPPKSVIIETPAELNNSPKPNLGDIKINPLNKGVFQGLTQGTDDGGGSVKTSFKGEGIGFIPPRGLKHSLGAPGEVVLKFNLDKNANIIPGSIEALKLSETRYYEEAVKQLKKFKFNFKGAPRDLTECEITIRFL